MTKNRTFTAAELATELAPIDVQLVHIQAALDSLKAVWTRDVPDAVGEAWNHLHDAHDALSEYRAQVALNLPPIPAEEYGTYLLALQNID